MNVKINDRMNNRIDRKMSARMNKIKIKIMNDK